MYWTSENRLSINCYYLLKCIGTTLPTSWAIFVNMGCDKSKCSCGGSHHPPLDPGGQKLVVVIVIDGAPGKQNWDWLVSHVNSKQAPQDAPLLNKVVLNAAVLTPYPCWLRFPYPHAPSVKANLISKYKNASRFI